MDGGGSIDWNCGGDYFFPVFVSAVASGAGRKENAEKEKVVRAVGGEAKEKSVKVYWKPASFFGLFIFGFGKFE